jgi:DNA polymerase I
MKNFAEQGLLSKKLAKIALDVPVTFNAAECKLSDYNKEELGEVFKDLEFKTIAREILGAEDHSAVEEKKIIKSAASKIGVQADLFGAMTGGDAPVENTLTLQDVSFAEKHIGNTEHTYYLVDNAEKRAELMQKLMQSTVVAYDSETTSIDANQAELVGMSFAVKAAEAFYVPFPANKTAAQAMVEEFRPFFESATVRKVGQNLKYDLIVLKWYNVEMSGVDFDTMLAHYLIEPDLRHNMNYMSATILKYEPVSIETLIGKGKNQLSMRQVNVEKVKEYAAEDADITFQLYEKLKESLSNTEGVNTLFETIEMPLVAVLTQLEYNGVRVDADYLNSFSIELELKVNQLENKIYELAGARFNIGSPKQVGDILFDVLKIPYRWKKTGKSGQYITDEEILAELAPNYPICQTILDYRGVAKLKSTYVDALPKMINPKTGRIHSSFNQALAATGRLASNNPNLQNIPIRTEEGRRVRMAFTPRDADHVLLSADYSQIELRLIAEIANETAMLEAFQQGLDIHTATAAKVYNVPINEVTSDQRRAAKTVNFSILYGAGATNLSNQLGIPRAEAKTIIEAYFTQYHGLKKYMETVVEDARKTGYVTTLMGRKRYLRDIDSRNALARSNSERVAVNTPIQGSAADLIKIAMINIHNALKERGLGTKMILQVHDELVFDVPKSELEIVKPLIEHCMKTAIPNLKVPIEVGMGVGNNWLEAH